MGEPSSKSESEVRQKAAEFVGRPPWKARTVWIAAIIMVVGGVWWLKDISASAVSTPGSPGASPSSGLAQKSGGESPSAPGPAVTGAPATFRFGASYLVGFFVGWTFRRFLKLSMLVAGGILALIALSKTQGWIDVDWAAIEKHVSGSFAWLKGEASALKTLITGYLPSAGAAGVGAFLGFRRK